MPPELSQVWAGDLCDPQLAVPGFAVCVCQCSEVAPNAQSKFGRISDLGQEMGCDGRMEHLEDCILMDDAVHGGQEGDLVRGQLSE